MTQYNGNIKDGKRTTGGKVNNERELYGTFRETEKRIVPKTAKCAAK